MAFPPTIPTSFVPHPTSSVPRRFRSDFTGAFGFFAYAVFGVVFALALGVFFYGRILAAEQSAKDAELAKAESTIDPETINSFIRLRDRLVVGKTLLENHVAFSGPFALFETLVPVNVRFVSLHLSIDDAKAVKLEGSGIAKSFNALAVASTAFARDGNIRDAIFSNIDVDPQNNSVSFSFSASLDAKIVAFSPDARSAVAAPVTASTSPSDALPSDVSSMP